MSVTVVSICVVNSELLLKEVSTVLVTNKLYCCLFICGESFKVHLNGNSYL